MIRNDFTIAQNWNKIKLARISRFRLVTKVELPKNKWEPIGLTLNHNNYKYITQYPYPSGVNNFLTLPHFLYVKIILGVRTEKLGYPSEHFEAWKTGIVQTNKCLTGLMNTTKM